jgi:hypothetical protein
MQTTTTATAPLVVNYNRCTMGLPCQRGDKYTGYSIKAFFVVCVLCVIQQGYLWREVVLFEIRAVEQVEPDHVLDKPQRITTTDVDVLPVTNVTTENINPAYSDRNSSRFLHCEALKARHGFWTFRQCDLWIDVIETNATIDMTPYLASAMPVEQHWWKQMGNVRIDPSLPAGTPPMSGADNNKKTSIVRGRLIYHLHVHKMGGTFFCDVFRKAKPRTEWMAAHATRNNTTRQRRRLKGEAAKIALEKYKEQWQRSNQKTKRGIANVPAAAAAAAAAKQTTPAHIQNMLANPLNNCNVPDQFWKELGKNKQGQALQDYAAGFPGGMEPMKQFLALHARHGWYQYAPYFGESRRSVRATVQRLTTAERSKRWVYLANEGSMEFEPIFGPQGPFFYSVILREPLSWLRSMHKYDGGKKSMGQYMQEIWGGSNFATRRLCGYECVFESKQVWDAHPERYFLRAKSMLDHFDSILLLEDMDRAMKDGTLGQLFPSLQFQHEIKPPASATTTTTGTKAVTYKRNEAKTAKPGLPAYPPNVLNMMHQHIWMDKVLYEYAKILVEKKH